MNSKLTIRWLIAFVAAVSFAVLAIVGLANIGATPLPSKLDWLNIDWLWYRDGMERLLAGRPLYDPALLAGPYNQLLPELEFTWNQAPSALVVVAPFYLIPEAARSSSFFVFSAVCAVLAVRLVWPRGWSGRSQLLLAVMLVPVLWVAIYWSNLITLTALGVALTWVGHRRQSAALMIIGLLCSGVVKVIPAVLLGLWLLTRRHYKVVGVALALGIITMLPAIVYDGVAVISQFLTSQSNALMPVTSTNFAPRVLAYHAGFDLPQVAVQVCGLITLIVALWPRRAADTAWLLLQVATLCFVANVWVHWPFIVVIAGLIWIQARAPRMARFEAWIDGERRP